MVKWRTLSIRHLAGGHTINDWAPDYLRETDCPCGKPIHGHRRGMCQWGAQALAKQGKTWRQIAEHYYDLEWRADYGKGEEITMGRSKTSLHVQRVESWMRPALNDWDVEWVKIVDPPADDPFSGVPRKLVRFYTDAWDEEYLNRGEQGGREYVQRMLPHWQACPWGHCFELPNEPDCNSNKGLANLNAFTLGAMREAEGHYLTVCAYNIPEGNPSGDHDAIVWKFQQSLPSMRAVVERGHYFGRHLYWRPDVEGPLGRYHALGRLDYDVTVLASLGLDIDRLKVLVNECGIDGGIEYNTPQQGWQHFVAANELTEREYVGQIVEFEKATRERPWLKGAMLFTAGFNPPWETYNHAEPVVRNIILAMQGLASSPEFTDEDRVALDRLWGRIPASWKEAMRKRELLGGEVPRESEGSPVLSITYNPAMGKFRQRKQKAGTWETVAEEDR